MISSDYRHRIATGILLALVTTGIAAQGVPRDENPLPPASEIKGVGSSPRTPTPGAATGAFEDVQQARDALEELLRAYETGNIAKFQQMLDPSMVGYQVFLNGVRRDVAAFRNLRIHLTDTQITAGPDLAVIQTAWEKRFLAAGDFTPGIVTGRSTVLMHRDGKTWRLSAVALDNPFSSASGVLARLTVTPMAISEAALNDGAPVGVEVRDADMAGVETVTVTVSTANGDRETLRLPSATPGLFRILTVPIQVDPAPATPNNGLVEVPGPGNVTFRYVDPNPGSDRPPTTLTRVMRVL